MKLNITMAILATLLTAGSLSAQQALPEQTQGNTTQANQTSTAETPLSKEQVFAKCLAITNQEQVAIAKFAKEKSTNEEVKALATTLEKAHLECLDELKVLASKEGAGRKGTNRTPPAASTVMHAVDFLQMHQEMSDQCLKDSKEMLSKKEGADFDACFTSPMNRFHKALECNGATVAFLHGEYARRVIAPRRIAAKLC